MKEDKPANGTEEPEAMDARPADEPGTAPEPLPEPTCDFCGRVQSQVIMMMHPQNQEAPRICDYCVEDAQNKNNQRARDNWAEAQQQRMFEEEVQRRLAMEAEKAKAIAKMPGPMTAAPPAEGAPV